MATHPDDEPSNPTTEAWLAGGEMGELMRATDWAKTPLGPVARWPQSLKTAVSICLSSPFPILIWWGPQFIKLYNDAYRPILGDKHPRALGQRGQECWAEIWHIIGPMLEGVITRGEATWSDDQMLPLHRHGFTEECYFTFAYSPIRDESGGVGGVFCAVIETTERVLAARRQTTLRELAAKAASATEAVEACRAAAATLASNSEDLPFAAIYLLDEDGTALTRRGGHGVPVTHDGLPASIPIDEQVDPASDIRGLILRAASGGDAAVLDGLAGRFEGVSEGPFPEAPRAAVMLPIPRPGQERPYGVLVAAVSPRRRLDEAYRSFLELAAGQIGAAIANARAREEDRRRAESLAGLDRAKTAFFTNVSHEFRTPLTLLIGPLERGRAADASARPDEQRRELEVAHRNALRLLKLVNTLLDFSLANEAGGPLALAEDPVPLDRVRPGPGIGQERERIVLADDNGDMREYLCRLLRDHWDIDAYADGAAALDAIRERRPALVIADVMMPRLDGFQLLHALRTGQRTRDIPVILLSARAGDEARVEGMAAGADDYLVKPFNTKELVARVDAQLRMQHVRREARHTHRRQMELLLIKQQRLLELIASGRPLDECLTALCASVPKLVPGARASIRLAGDERPSVDAAGHTTPIVGTDGRPLGSFTLSFEAAREPSDWERRVGEVGARLAAIAVEGRRTELALRGSEERYRAIVESQAEMVCRFRPDGTILFVNGAYARARGTTPEALAGVNFWTFIEEQDRPGVRALLDRLRPEAPQVRIENRFETTEGVRWTLWTNRGLAFDADGRATEVQSTGIDITARKQAEEALQESEERYRKLIALLPVGVYSCEAPSGIITFYNSQAAALWGRTPAVGDTEQRFCGSFRLWRPDGSLLPHGETPMAVALREGREFRNEDVVIERPDGTRIRVLVNIDPIRDPAGAVVGAVNAFHDVSAIKQAEDALRFRTAQYETLLDRAPLGVYLVDADFRLREVNPTAREAFGSIPDLIGRKFDEVLNLLWRKEYADEIAGIFRRTLETGESYRTLERIEDRVDRGVTESYEWRTDRILLPDGRHGVVCYFRDISAEVTARAEIAASEERFRTLVSLITDVPWSTDARGAFVTFQPKWAEYTGQTWEELRGFGWADALHPDDRDEVMRTWRRACEGRAVYESHGRLWHAASGQYRHFVARATPVLAADGSVREWVGTCTDVHLRQIAEEELRQSEAQLRRSSQMKDEFLATLSHELRTPLNAVLGWAHLLRGGNLEPEVARRALESLDRNARAQTQLVDDLLDMSRIVSGKMQIKSELVDLALVIRGAVDTVRLAAVNKGVSLKVRAAPTPRIQVNGDADRLQQIVWNLLVNGIKFTPGGGRVEVALRRDKSHAEIVVRDTGEGIDRQFLPFVFDRFQQADGTTTRRHGGLGLGLAIVRHLTEAHGGTIRADSDGPNSGAAFTLRLPLAAERARVTRTAGGAGRRAAPTALDGARILVVDDEADARDLLRVLLASHGAEVIVAGSAGEALHALANRTVDTLVADIGMPEKDGLWLIRAVRDLRGPQRVIPAVAVTAYASLRDRELALEAGYGWHVAKPIDPEQLVTVVAEAIRRAVGGPKRTARPRFPLPGSPASRRKRSATTS